MIPEGLKQEEVSLKKMLFQSERNIPYLVGRLAIAKHPKSMALGVFCLEDGNLREKKGQWAGIARF